MEKIKTKLKLLDILDDVNVAERLTEDELMYIGDRVVRYYERDLQTRSDWESRMENAMKLALQIAEEKSFPWEGAANVKYPLLTISAIQFAARAYPSLIKSPSLVHAIVTGNDPTDEKLKRADRVSKYMSYQFLREMENWEDDMDRMLLTLPIMGSIFKKCYPDFVQKKPVTELIYAWDLVFDYWAKDVDKVSRKTHRIWLTENELVERQRAGLFLKQDLAKADAYKERKLHQEIEGTAPTGEDEDAPRETLEMHCFWDLDNDGYKEPYIITVDRETRLVHRIVPRFTEKDITFGDNREIIRVEPEEYFTQYTFIHDPNGGALGLGFGHFLSPINESINTLINQLLDAGTLSILQSGFLGSGLRIKAGETRLRPGEWKIVRTSGMDLKNNIVPLPIKEPSQVLFMLLELLVNSGERLSSVTESMTGQTPPANTPASTTMAMIEQGMMVFTGIYKRIYRAMSREFKKVYDMNKYLVTGEKQFSILDSPQNDIATVDGSDFVGDDTAVTPTADPNMATEQQKLVRGQVLGQLTQMGGNPQAVLQYHVDVMDVPDKYKQMLLQPPPPPPPDPRIQIEQAKLQMEMAEKEAEARMAAEEARMKAAETQLQMMNDRKEHQIKMEEMRLAVEKLRKEIQKVEAETAKIKADAARPKGDS